MSYEFRGYAIRDNMLQAMREYAEHGVPMGDFLTAVAENNLREACSRADHENLANLPAFVAWFYNEAPSRCWGSPEDVRIWLEKHRQKREAQDAAVSTSVEEP